MTSPLCAQSNVRPLPASLRWSETLLTASRVTPPTLERNQALAVPTAPEEGSVELELSLSARASSDFESGMGSYRVQRGGWDARIGAELSDDATLTFGLHTEASFYSFADSAALVPGVSAPFNDLYETALGVSLTGRIAERFALLVGAEVQLSGDDEAALSEALSYSGLLGTRYQAREQLALSFGFALRSRLEADAIAYPFLGFDWRPSERWHIAAEGPNARVEFQASSSWTLFGEARYELRQFRLNEDGPLASAVVRDEEIDLLGGAVWKPMPGLELSLGVGLAAWQEFNVLDSSGDSVSETESDVGPIAAFTLELAF